MDEDIKLNFETFAANLNTSFRVTSEEGPIVELRLIVANDKSVPRQEMFSLIFIGPDQTFLPQRNYSIEHDQIGAFALFIVPIGRDEDGYQYEAVFNRIRN